VSVLRIFCPLTAVPAHCAWLLLDNDTKVQAGEGALAQLPQGAARVQLVLAASQVLLTRAHLPPTSKRRAAAVLAYAVEENLASDPDGNQISRLGPVDDDAVLAVVSRQRLQSWRDALAAAGIRVDGVYCETLMLPLREGEWSLAWNGRDGFVRTGELEGGACDCGDRHAPPLALHLLLDAARARDALPAAIAIHAAPSAQPDLAAWQQSLGVPVRLAAAADWRAAPAMTAMQIVRERPRWRPTPATLAPWRHIGWIVSAALILHSGALLADRLRLGSAQQQLRQQMETRFRALFPAAVAVADPALQTRRQLAAVRHAAGQPDAGDFPVMLGKLAPVLADMPTARLRVLAYEDGRTTLEFLAPGDPLAHQIQARLVQAGFAVEVTQPARAGNRGTLTLTLRSP
jgi:general secretion pathway protein L